RAAGANPKRNTERQDLLSPPQPPPRTTRPEASLTISGSVPPGSFASYQSRHSSQTLPCMSCSPQGFAPFLPTSCARLLELARDQPKSTNCDSALPKLYAV